MIIKAIRIWELAHKDECRRLLLGERQRRVKCEAPRAQSALAPKRSIKFSQY